MKILLIDDDKENLECMSCFLGIKGFSLKAFSNPQKAIDAYKREAFDVVITDWKMPVLNGLEVLKAVRTHNPAAYVIILTGVLDKANLAEALNSGAFDFFYKPIRDVEGFADTLLKIERKINTVGIKYTKNGGF